MQTSFSGIVLGGELQLDQQVPLADQSRVHVTIVPMEQNRGRWTQALNALEELKRQNPINSGGQRFTRDQLHERG
jgi:hypothetical protein